MAILLGYTGLWREFHEFTAFQVLSNPFHRARRVFCIR